MQIPFITTAAGFGYLTLLALLFSPSSRQWFLDAFELRPPSTGQHLLALDTLRGLAALYVASYHSWQWLQPFHDSVGDQFPVIQQGPKGVAIFAALSGYLIYKSLRGRLDQPGALRSYAIRRLLRIYPVYAVTVIACALLGQMRGNPTVWHGLGADLALLQIFGMEPFANALAWSVYVEMIFYFTLPFILALLNQRSILWPAVGFGLASLVLTFPGTKSPQLIPFFAVGIVAVECAQRLERLPRGRIPLAIALVLGGATLLLLDIHDHRLLAELFTQFGALIDIPLATNATRSLDLAVAMAGLLTGLTHWTPRWLTAFPLRFLGVISYSLYLWHGLLLTLDQPIRMTGSGSRETIGTIGAHGDWTTFFLIYLPGLIACSACSYLLIERPFLRIRPTST